MNQPKNENIITIFNKVFLIFGLMFGCYIFYRYWSVKENLSSELLPSYIVPFLNAEYALKGFILFLGLTFSNLITFIKKHRISLLINILTLLILILSYFI